MALSVTQLHDSNSLLYSVSNATLRVLPKPRSAELTVSVVRGDRTIIDRYATDWNTLCSEGPCNLPFFTTNWISAWLESFAPDAKVVLVLAMRNGELRGVLPFIEKRIGFGGIGFTRFVQPANVHSCRIDIIHGAGDRDDVVAALWNALQTNVKWDVIEYRDVPATGGFCRMASSSRNAGYPLIDRKTLESPVIQLGPEADVAKLGPAKDLRRSRRLLEKAGGYEYIRHDPVQPETVDRLLQMEAAGWKGENGTAILCNEDERAFYTSIMTNRTSAITPVIHEIRLEGESVAFNFGIEMGDAYVEPKGTYSEQYRKFGPGHLLMHETAARLQARGFASFDLLGHVESYKAQWTSNTLVHHQFLIFRKNLIGRGLRWGVETLIPRAKVWKSRSWSQRFHVTWLNRPDAASPGSGK
jgi:CelD/BcsL family acetyltransferase involved in cellulose biosynthesis